MMSDLRWYQSNNDPQKQEEHGIIDAGDDAHDGQHQDDDVARQG